METKVENYGPFDLAGTGDDVSTGNPFNTMLLPDGLHEITAFIELSDGSSELVRSEFTVDNSRPALAFDAGTLSFSAEEGILPPDQAIYLDALDSSNPDFTLSTNVSWLSVTPLTGVTPETLTVSINDSALVPGVYSGTITASATGYSDAVISVTYTVTSAGGNIYDLLVSANPDRSGAVSLDGQIVSGDIYVFTGPDTNVKRVTFSIDGVETKVENYGPFDLAGTGDDVSTGNTFDTIQLTNGQHEVMAFVELFDGSSELVRALFTVTN